MGYQGPFVAGEHTPQMRHVTRLRHCLLEGGYTTNVALDAGYASVLGGMVREGVFRVNVVTGVCAKGVTVGVLPDRDATRAQQGEDHGEDQQGTDHRTRGPVDPHL